VKAPSYEEFRFVAGSVSRETFDSVVAFEAIFRKWAARINLVGPSTLNEIWQRHILDSAQLARIEPHPRKWLDLGSGGGFPGAIMALVLKDRPGASIDLVESNSKKAAFLRTALAELGAPARIHAKRIEDAYSLVREPEIVTARALAPLVKLLDLAEPWLASGAKGLFHKGREYQSEIKESAAAWNHDLVEHKSLIDADSVILEVRNLRRRGPHEQPT
jgi:16S rRNA (guanine527-N7)-methyltransferase